MSLASFHYFSHCRTAFLQEVTETNSCFSYAAAWVSSFVLSETQTQIPAGCLTYKCQAADLQTMLAACGPVTFLLQFVSTARVICRLSVVLPPRIAIAESTKRAAFCVVLTVGRAHPSGVKPSSRTRLRRTGNVVC